jgi:outer membrane protein assembly factor BamB
MNIPTNSRARRAKRSVAQVGAWVACMLMLCAQRLTAADWLQFRSAAGNSVAQNENLPLEWSDDAGIAWKNELPGRGPSGPIVVDGRVIVTSSSGADQDRLHVLCFSASTGKQLWERQFWATGRTITHPMTSVAAPTPASDGERIFAFFSSNDLVCLDLHGNLLWLRGLGYDYPKAGNDVGMASSPTVIGETVIVQVENQGDSFAAGIDTRNGETRWRIERPKEPSWTSPAPFRGNDQDLVLLQSPSKLTAHNPATGEQVWSYDAVCDGIPTTTAAEGLIFVPSAGVTALEPKQGEPPQVKWKAGGVQPATACPIIADSQLYAINRAGVLTAAHTSDGSVAWRVRLEGAFWGTPVLAGNRLYCINQEGLCQVVQIDSDGKRAQIVGRGDFKETVLSSSAAADGALYVRSDRHLWKVAAPK